MADIPEIPPDPLPALFARLELRPGETLESDRVKQETMRVCDERIQHLCERMVRVGLVEEAQDYYIGLRGIARAMLDNKTSADKVSKSSVDWTQEMIKANNMVAKMEEKMAVKAAIKRMEEAV